MEGFQKILDDLGSVHWWFTAFVFAVLVNLLSPRIDRFLAARWHAYAKHRLGKSQAEVAIAERRAMYLADSPLEMLHAEIQVWAFITLSVVTWLATFAGFMFSIFLFATNDFTGGAGGEKRLSFLLISWMPGAAGCLCLAGAMACQSRAQLLARALDRARDIRREMSTAPASRP